MDNDEQNFSFKQYFVPFTSLKAVHFIILIGLVVFANTLFNGFVWDDKTFILFNPDLSSFNLLHLIQANSFNSDGQYRPLPAIYFATMYGMFHGTSFFYHFFQLLLHITNTIILFFIFRYFFNRQLSFFLALIFLIHPMQVESVSYISASDNPLFFLFGSSALLLGMTDKINDKKCFIINGLLLLSLLTKETGILFLLTILFYRWLFKKKDILPLLFGSVTTFIIYLYMRIFIGGAILLNPQLASISRLPLNLRLLNIPEMVLYYIKTFFYPAVLSIDQQWVVTTINANTFYFPLLIDALFFILLGIIGVVLFKRKRINFRIFLFFFVWFCFGLFFHLQIFPMDMTVADRWFYFPMVGLLGLIGISVQSIKFSNKHFYTIAYAIWAILLVLLSIRTVIRNSNWVDQVTLFNHDAKISDNFFIETDLGFEYIQYEQVHNYNEALKHFLKAASFLPSETTYDNVAYTYENLNNISEAKAFYKKALSSKNYLEQTHQHDESTYLKYIYKYYFIMIILKPHKSLYKMR